MPDGSRDVKEQTLAAQAVGSDSGSSNDDQTRIAGALSSGPVATDWPGGTGTVEAPLQFSTLSLDMYFPALHLSGFGGQFSQQWYLDNTGQSGGTAGVDLNVTSVWDDYTGAGVTVGVMDDGIEYTHPDLDGNYDSAIDWDGAQNDGTPLPVNGWDNHGTAVAGIIAAENDGTGSLGVAYDATLVGFRTDYWTVAQLGDLLSRQQNVDVGNNSWGSTLPFLDNINDPSWISVFGAISNAAIQGRENLGTVLVFAGGNERASGDNVNFHNLQNSVFTIAVGAHDHNGIVTNYSTPGAALLVSAPSSQNADGTGNGGIYTTDRSGPDGYVSGEYFAAFGGTSAAAPMVSGVVALMLEANPNLGYRDVQEILAYSARQTDPGNATWQYNNATNWNGGGLHTSTDYGFGAVDALAAVRLAETWEYSNTYSNLDETGQFVRTTVNTAVANFATVDFNATIASGVTIDQVEVFVDGSHPDFTDLILTLISPSGTESVIGDMTSFAPYYDPSADLDGAFYAWTFTSTQFWGEDSAGTWTLRIEDTTAVNAAGVLGTWALRIYGDDEVDDTYVFTDAYADFTGAADAARRVLTDLSGGSDDTLNAAAVTTGSYIDLTPGAVSTIAGNSLTIDAGTVIERAYGGDGDDTIIGNEADSVLFGGRGDDTLMSGGGDLNYLDGGEGNDTLIGVVGEYDRAMYVGSVADYTFTNLGGGWIGVVDNVHGVGEDALMNIEFVQFDDGSFTNLSLILPTPIVGTASDDVLTNTFGQDLFDGGAGTDWVSYEPFAAVTVDLQTPSANSGTAIGDTYTNIENLRGSRQDDTLSGDANDNVIDGNNGNDTISGGAGNDSLIGGSGTDTAVYAGSVADFVIADLGSGQYRITDTVNGQGTDTLSGIEFVTFQEDSTTLGVTSLPLTIAGTAGDDSLVGTANNDVLSGDAGNDTLDGGAGADTLDGGTGTDTASYANASAGVVADLATPANNTGEAAGDTYTSIENLTGSAYDDSLTGDAADNVLTGSGGNDDLNGGAGNDTLIGGAGNDTIDGGAGTDTAHYTGSIGEFSFLQLANGDIEVTDNVNGQGTDTLTDVEFLEFSGGGGPIAVGGLPYGINGTAGDDVLVGTGSDETINGMGGNDDLTGGGGNDTIDGGAGTDTANYTGNVADFSFVRLANGDIRVTDNAGTQGTDTLTDVEFLTFSVSGTIAVGNLSLTHLAGTGGNNSFTGGAGRDAASYANATGGIVASLTDPTGNTGDATGDSYSGIEDLIGSNYGDRLSGDGGDNRLDGGAGDDMLDGGLGNDTISGGAGYDTLKLDGCVWDFTVTNLGGGIYRIEDAGSNAAGAQGTKTVDGIEGIQFSDGAPKLNLVQIASAWWGGSDADSAEGTGALDMLYGGDGDDALGGGTGADALVGGAGNDNLDGSSGSDTLYGQDGDDYLNGGSGHDFAAGGDGNDILRGASGDDTLRGGDGDDTIYGDAGDDLLAGGHGADWLYGGADNDRFLFENGDGDDTVSGFAAGAGSDDVADVSAFNYADFATLLADITQVGGDAVLQTSSGDTLTFAGVDRDDLHQDDFTL